MNVVNNSYLEYLLEGKLIYSKDNSLDNISEAFVVNHTTQQHTKIIEEPFEKTHRVINYTIP